LNPARRERLIAKIIYLLILPFCFFLTFSEKIFNYNQTTSVDLQADGIFSNGNGSEGIPYHISRISEFYLISAYEEIMEKMVRMVIYQRENTLGKTENRAKLAKPVDKVALPWS
jgi:hypothetical protein